MSVKVMSIGPRSQFAALPWRRHGDDFEVLVITSRISRHWLIPKGSPMKGKSDAEAAAREAFEEAGVKGVISSAPIGSYAYDKLLPEGGSLPCLVEVYALQVEKELPKWPEDRERERLWMPPAEAAVIAFEPGLAQLLKSFDFEAYAAEHQGRGRRHKGG